MRQSSISAFGALAPSDRSELSRLDDINAKVIRALSRNPQSDSFR
jgi:hypothetical protein